MSRFAKYLGDMELNVGGEKFVVRPTLRHKQQLLGMHQSGSTLDEAAWGKQHSLFKSIIKTTEPDATDEELDAFLVKHDMEFMLQLFVGFGWTKEEDIADISGIVKKEIEKKTKEELKTR